MLLHSLERLEIYTLNSFVVKRGAENLSVKYKRSKKLWLLLKCLIANRGKVMGVDRLSECVCPEEELDNPKQVFQNLAYRLRKMLEEADNGNQKSIIVFEQDGYRWNTGSLWLDVEVFEDLCRKGFNSNANQENAITYFREAMLLYKNGFLEENKNEEWVQIPRAYYRDIYLKAVHALINLLNLNGRYDEIIETAKKALLIDYYDTSIHVEYLKALLEKGHTREALSHYEEATGKLYLQAGIMPTAEMNAIYKNIKYGKKDVSFTLTDIKSNLTAKNEVQTQCTLQKENSKDNPLSNRIGSAYFVLFTVVLGDTPIKPIESMDMVMKRMSDILLKTIRKTDMIYQWNEHRFVILLFDLEIEHTEQVFNRIIKEYQKAYPESSAIFLKSIYRINSDND